MNEEKRRVYVGSNKQWHQEECSRKNNDDSMEELIVVEENLLRYWITSTKYMCPECEATIEVTD